MGTLEGCCRLGMAFFQEESEVEGERRGGLEEYEVVVLKPVWLGRLGKVNYPSRMMRSASAIHYSRTRLAGHPNLLSTPSATKHESHT